MADIILLKQHESEDMKILSIIDSDKAYGKERANLEVDNIMKENGSDVVILINQIADISIREELSEFHCYEVPFPRNLGKKNKCWKYFWAFTLTQFYMLRLFRKEKPDYVLIPTEIALAYLYIPLLVTNSKVVFRCGDSPLVFRKQGLLAKVYKHLWRFLFLKRVDKVVCNAEFLQQQLKKSGRISNNKDVVIYNYPPIRIERSDNVLYNNHPNTLRIGFIGRIVKDKGVRELICAVKQLNKEGEKVVVYICGDMGIDKEYTKIIIELSDKSIEFVGFVKDLDKFYQNVDIVVIPSIYPEPMANVVTEAKFHSKPVVIFNQGGMPEIVEHKYTGYICPEVSVECLAEGIKYYIDNPNLTIEHGNNAFLSIEKLGLTKEEFTKKWLAVFEVQV